MDTLEKKGGDSQLNDVKSPLINNENDKGIYIKLSSSNIKKLVVCCLVVIVSLFCGIGIYNSNNEKRYDENVKKAISTMLDGAILAEETAYLIHDVWYNTIYKEADLDTNYYTLTEYNRSEYRFSLNVPEYCFNEDFNDSLRTLFSDSVFKNKLSSIESNKRRVDSIMKILVNVPDGKDNVYSTIENLYDQYLGLVDCALNPSGNLSSFTQKINSYDSGFVQAYKKAELHK